MKETKQSIKNFRFSDTDVNVPLPQTTPIKNSLFDYLQWVAMEYPDLIDHRDIHTEHFFRKNDCIRNKYYSIFECVKCHTFHWAKLPCSSFFCEGCHEYLVKRAQSSLAGYLWNVRHRYLVFTTPPEIWNKLNWGTMHWFYKVVYKTLTYYFNHYYKKNTTTNTTTGKSRKVSVGMMAVLHSYASKDLEWQPHMNVMITCRGFKQKVVKGEIKTFAVNTSYINYDILRDIYKRNLEYYFNVTLKHTPQIKADDKKYQEKNDRKTGIPPQRVISSLAQYFKKLPFRDKAKDKEKSDIITVDGVGNITWTNYKRKKLKLDPITTPPIKFYNLIMQHIPPKNFRNVRLWGCYQYNHHLRKAIPPLKKPTAEKERLCLVCQNPLELKGVVCAGETLFPIFNYKDFSSQQEHPDLRGGRPPDEWDPPKDLTFSICIKKEEKKSTEAQPQPIKQPLDQGITTQGYDAELFNPKIHWNKSTFLDKLYYEIGKQTTNFRLCKTYIKQGEQFFSKWHNYPDIQGTMFLDKCNQREQLHNEIVLDQDKGDYKALIQRLKKDGIRFYAYATEKGRAQHIHCYFKGLAELNKFDRENLREKFIKKYGCDLMLKSDSHMIAMEFCEHWKTGEIKKLIDCNEGMNTIISKAQTTETEHKEFEEFLKNVI